MLHTIVGFVADFPVRDDGSEPVGRELAEFIFGELKKAGINTSPPQDREGWAWDVITYESDYLVETIVGIVDDMKAIPPRQWLITNNCALPLLSRLFGRSEAEAQRERLLRAICDAIHAGMQRDQRFSHVTWYRDDTFDKPGDVSSNQP